MRIDHVRAHEADRLRELRLASLQADPDAFGATYESDAARPPSWWERGARLSDAGDEQRTFVVVGDDGRWLGMALVRPDDETPGEAVLNAMWVAPEARGRGSAQALCEACAQWAAEHGFSALNDRGRRRQRARPARPTSPPASASSARTRGPATAARSRSCCAARCADALRRVERAGALSCATIACTRALSAATRHPDHARDVAHARAGQPHGEDRPVARVQPRRGAGLHLRASPRGSTGSPRSAHSSSRSEALLSSTPSAPAIAAASISSADGSAT